MQDKNIQEIIDEMIEKIEDMPPSAMSVYLNHYDLLTLLYLLKSIDSKSNPKEENE